MAVPEESTMHTADVEVVVKSVPAATQSGSSAGPSKVETAPAQMSAAQCLFPGTRILCADGSIKKAAALHPGDRLYSVCDARDELLFSTVIVKAVRMLPSRERTAIAMSFIAAPGQAENAVISMTADHELLAGCAGRAGEWWRTRADQLAVARHVLPVAMKERDSLTHTEATLLAMDRETCNCEVVELELQDPTHAVLLANSSTSCFAIVFGNPPRPELLVLARGSFLEVVETPKVASSSRSDPTPSHVAAVPAVTRIYCTIRQPHGPDCTARCDYHFRGQCRNGVLCPRCQNESHRGEPSRRHRGTRRSRRDGAEDA